MSLSLTDATTGTAVFSGDNSGNVDIGSGTPTSGLSVGGKAVLVGSSLRPASVTPGAMSRYAGTVYVPLLSTATISGATFAGFGSVSNKCCITRFALPNSFTVANNDGNAVTATYTVF